MKKLFSVKNKNLSIKGFTLIEVIVVIGIIALLTTVIYASLSGARAQNRDQQRVADISNIQLALELYFNMKKQYPDRLWSETGIECQEGITTCLTDVPNIFPQKLNPPGNYAGDGYFYVPLGGSKCISYHLWTRLETKNNSALTSRKGFDSTDVSVCEGGNGDHKVNAFLDRLIYDVTP